MNDNKVIRFEDLLSCYITKVSSPLIRVMHKVKSIEAIDQLLIKTLVIYSNIIYLNLITLSERIANLEIVFD